MEDWSSCPLLLSAGTYGHEAHSIPSHTLCPVIAHTGRQSVFRIEGLLIHYEDDSGRYHMKPKTPKYSPVISVH